MTVADPSVSTEGRFLIMAFFEAMDFTPMASDMVIRAGKPSGMAATARLTEARKISRYSKPCRRPIINVRTETKRMTTNSNLLR
jgi:hypothetical protein